MKRFLVLFCLISFLVPSFMFSQNRVLRVMKVANAPVIDGVVEQLWQSAPELNVPIGQTFNVHNPASILDCSGCHSYNSSYSLKLKAVYTTDRVFILAKWTDSTASLTRNGSWDFSTGSWSKPNGSQSEDRIAMFFPIGQIGGNPYNTNGCMSKCHTYYPTDQDPHVSTHGIVDDAWLQSGKADMWHSKAGRGTAYLSAAGSNLTINPITHEVTGGTFSMTGFMDDKWVGPWAPDSINGEDGGRYADAGGSGYSNNQVGTPARPKYMETAPLDYADAMVLKDTEITNGECVGNATTGVSDGDAAIYWANYAALNAIVPERILKAPTGSRGNVDFGAVWNNNEWTAEFSRSLLNGNEDDVQFNILNNYTFGTAIFENSKHGYEHRTSRMDTLIFDPAVPVELVSFSASAIGSSVSLTWSTATENNNKGFTVERKVNDSWTDAGFIGGKGTSTLPTNYSFVDNVKSINGKVSYRLRQIDFDGTSHLSKEVEVNINSTPSTYSLNQNFPNPFNPSTMISFNLPFQSKVKVTIYNGSGEVVRVLVNGDLAAGTHEVKFDTKGISIASGIYFYSIEATSGSKSFKETKKMMLLK